MARWFQILLERSYWKEILWTALIILGAWAAARAFVVIVDTLGRSWARRTNWMPDRALDAIRKPGSLLIFLTGVYAALHRYSFRLLTFLDGVIFIAAVFIVVHTLTKILVGVLTWYGGRAREREREALAREVLPFADKVVRIVFFVIGLLVILDHFRIDIRSILVTLGIGSLAIGLALQDTLANMFGGFTIMLDRPFRVGDRIQLSSGELGDVQAIGMRTTSVLTPEGHILIIPNAQLVKTMLTNHSFPDDRARIIIRVGIRYGSDTEEAKRLILDVARQDSRLMRRPEPAVFFESFGESTLNLMLECYTADFRSRMVITDALNSSINSKFVEAGIEIPFPTQTIHLREEGNTPDQDARMPDR